MIQVSFTLESGTNPTQEVDLARVLDGMQAAIDDIAGHLEAVGIYPDIHDMEQTMSAESIQGGE